MLLHPEIIEFPQTALVGISMSMSLVNNQTGALWQAFMPTYVSLSWREKPMRYSLQEYPAGYFETFNPHREFTKWALCAWEPLLDLPLGWAHYTVAGGQYALFKHRGADTGIFERIFSEWLPSSGYALAQRPHFEMFSPTYRQGDEQAEEVIAIPITGR